MNIPVTMSKASACLLLALILAAAARAEDGREELPTYGVSFESPDGWVRAHETSTKEAARWERRAADGTLQGVLLVKLVDRRGQDLEEVSAKLAKEMKGELRDEETTLDGERARVVVVKRTDGKVGPARLVVALHEERVYVLEAWAATDSGFTKELEALRESSKLIPVASPASALGSTKEVATPFGLEVTVPVCFRRFHEEHAFQFGARNATTEKIELALKIDRAEETGLISKVYRKFAEKSIQISCNAPSLRYVRVGESPNRWLTGPGAIGGTEKNEDCSIVRWGLVDVEGARPILFTFLIDPRVSAADRAAYEKACEDIMKSIKVE